MRRRRLFKQIHFASTAWFILCAGCVWVISLLQAGRSWWFIVSLTGYSTLTAFLLISLYLFAIYRGFARSHKIKIEHPLTTSVYYSLFYDTCPFLGSLGGLFAATGTANISEYLLITATGSLWTTFLVWIIVDPATGLVEMLLPSSRSHRKIRLARARSDRKTQYLDRQNLLEKVRVEEKLERDRWCEALKPYAEKLSILIADRPVDEVARTQAVDIGVSAWQMGGIGCMRLLHQMARDIAGQKYENMNSIDRLSLWWDGIGCWRSRWPDEVMC